MSIPFFRTFEWPDRYGAWLQAEFGRPSIPEQDIQSLKVEFAGSLSQILIREGAVHGDPMRLAALIDAEFPRFNHILRKTQWECFVHKFSNSKTTRSRPPLTEDEEVNVRFEELLTMSDDQVTAWIDLLRRRVIEIWDENGIPPMLPDVALSATVDAFRKISRVQLVPRRDGQSLDPNVLIDDSRLGSHLQQFFPAMLQTKINYDSRVNSDGTFSGYSVYDLFADANGWSKLQTGCRRHFRRDSFYRYSRSVAQKSSDGLGATSGSEWVKLFRESPLAAEYGYWLSYSADLLGSGYTQIDATRYLSLSGSEVLALYASHIIPASAIANLTSEPSRLKTSVRGDGSYYVRLYKKSVRLFPSGYSAFKIGYAQTPANFSPVIAKYLYEKYTESIKGQEVLNVYDPCAGWGGRIAGAMTVKQDRHIHYIGTDPNSRNYIADLGLSRYEHVAWFINNALEMWDLHGARGYRAHSIDLFRLGSEVIGSDSRFQQYEGKVDLVLSSPPFFSRELYSDDETQSVRRFPTYDEWRQRYLRPTLETAFHYLRANRHLLWNVSDICVGERFCPIEQDSIDILRSLGAELVGIEWMALANMPGSNRVNREGLPTAINYVTIDGSPRKAEPIYVFRKQ